MWNLKPLAGNWSASAGPQQNAPARKRSGPVSERLVRVGLIPLVDMAVLVAAAEQGFARREAIRLQLVKDVSWSNIRDRLAFRQFDVAHMLSPMPIASQLGLGSNPAPCLTPFALGRGGNAVTLSIGLYRDMQAVAGLAGSEDALTNGIALKQVIDRRARTGRKPLVLAVPYPFSPHHYELRFWLAAAGIDPDGDLTITVVPPQMTVDAMTNGSIDGFCVNAPWSQIAVERGVGRMVAAKADIWAGAPEKVLGVNPGWMAENPDTLSRLIVALDAAARWCADPENHGTLADMLADPAYLGVPANLIRCLLDGQLTVDPDGRTRQIDGYLTFHDQAANFPWISQALWIYSQMVRWGQVAYQDSCLAKIHAAYRPDLYRRALAGTSTAVPEIDSRIEGAGSAFVSSSGGDIILDSSMFIDGRPFDPDAIPAYVSGFGLRTQ